MNESNRHTIGIGLRREIAAALLQDRSNPPEFLELAPENWMEIGGHWGKVLEEAAARYPLTAHGLSLSIGSSDPIDLEFLKRIKAFLDRYEIQLYSEHLSFSKSDNAHMFELLPLPFNQDAVTHIVDRIQVVQDLLQRPLVLENVSYYSVLDAEMRDTEFISEIVSRSGCKLLLDVNNVHVNATNHGYDAHEFLNEIPIDHVAYIHMAGYTEATNGLLIDSHAEPISAPVFSLFEQIMPRIPEGTPVLLERDSHFDNVDLLFDEMDHLRRLAHQHV